MARLIGILNIGDLFFMAVGLGLACLIIVVGGYAPPADAAAEGDDPHPAGPDPGSAPVGRGRRV